MSDYIDRAEAQTAIQFVAKRYTVAHEAHGNGRVVWSDILIPLTDAMNALRDVPSAQPEIIRCKDCKYQVKEWREDKRFKDNGYWAYGCKVISDVCGYWAWFGQDDEFCSDAERRTDE